MIQTGDPGEQHDSAGPGFDLPPHSTATRTEQPETAAQNLAAVCCSSLRSWVRRVSEAVRPQLMALRLAPSIICLPWPCITAVLRGAAPVYITQTSSGP